MGTGKLTLSGSINVQSASTLDAVGSGGLLNVTGPMYDSGGITVASSSGAGGVVVYSNSMTYTGPTTINSGATLQLGVGGSLGSGGSYSGAIPNNGAWWSTPAARKLLAGSSPAAAH